MAFVNQFASDEDIKKYRLNELWKKFRPAKDEIFKSGHGMFTIDRKQNILYIPIRQGVEEHSNRTTALLCLDGKCITIKLDKVDGLVNNPDGIDSNPYIVTWDLVGVYPPKDCAESKERIIDVLKRALTAYGFNGANRQLPNTIVRFKF